MYVPCLMSNEPHIAHRQRFVYEAFRSFLSLDNGQGSNYGACGKWENIIGAPLAGNELA